MKIMRNLLPGLIAMTATAVLLVTDRMCPEPSQTYSDILFGVTALLLYPSEEERKLHFLVLTLSAFILYLLPILVMISGLSTGTVRVLTTIIWILTDLALKTLADYRQIRRLFHNEQVWKTLQDRSRMSFALMELSVLLVCIVLKANGLCAILLGVLFAILFLRSLTGWSLIISRKKERFITALIKGSLKNSSENDNTESDVQMNSLYNKIKRIMEEKKPYLDETLSLESFSTMVGTNKLYLSRTINIMSGKNFRQFINAYRVEYAMNIFREDSQAKIEEVSLKSGFHTLVTFDMAFRIVMDMTPSEWLHKYRVGVLK